MNHQVEQIMEVIQLQQKLIEENRRQSAEQIWAIVGLRLLGKNKRQPAHTKVKLAEEKEEEDTEDRGFYSRSSEEWNVVEKMEISK